MYERKEYLVTQCLDDDLCSFCQNKRLDLETNEFLANGEIVETTFTVTCRNFNICKRIYDKMKERYESASKTAP